MADDRQRLKLRPGAFFDRDGVVNYLVTRDGGSFSPRSYLDFRICEDIPGIFRELRAQNFQIVVVTNQPDVARGYLAKGLLDRMSSKLVGIGVDAVYVCPHDQVDNCSCRKPLPGLLVQAINDLQLDVQQSFLVGDRETDVLAAYRAGVSGYQIAARTSDSLLTNPSDLRLLLSNVVREKTGRLLNP